MRRRFSVTLSSALSVACLWLGCADSEPDESPICPWYQRCGEVDGVSCGTCDDGDPCTQDACVDGRCTTLAVSDACACAATCPPDDTLRLVQTVHQGDGGVSGLETILALAVSPDGRDTYVAAGGVSLVQGGVVAASWSLKPIAESPPSSVAVVGEGVVAVGTAERLYLFTRTPSTGELAPLGVVERPVAGLATRGTTLLALDGQGLWALDLSSPSAPRVSAARVIPQAAGARALLVAGQYALVAGFAANLVVVVDLESADLAVVGEASGKPGLMRPDALAVLDATHVAVAGFCDNAVAVLKLAPDGTLSWLTAFEPEGAVLSTGPAEGCPTAESPEAFIHPGALAAAGERLLVMTGARRYFAAEWLRWDGTHLVSEGPLAEQPATFDGSGMDYITDPTPAAVPFDPLKLRGLVSAASSPAGIVAASAISNAVATLTPTSAGPFLQRGAGGADGLTCVAGLALSPDGADVYTASRCIPAIGRLRVDPARGTLVPQPTTPVPNTEAYDLIAAVALPDNDTLAAVTASPTSSVAGRVHSFVRGADGALTHQHEVSLGSCDGKRAFPVGLLALGPDLYIADFQREGASCIHHARNGLAGLTLAESVVSADVGGIESFAATADGRFVYTACYVAEAVTAFRRDPVSGTLELLGRFSVPETRGAEFVALSPDERHVYVSSPVESTLVVWERDPEGGELSVVQALRADDQLLLRDAAGLAVSPDGERVYLSARGSDALTVFARDAQSGQVSLRQTLQGLYDWPNAVLAAPDGHHVYVAGVKSSSVTVLRRDASGDGCLGECP